MGFTKYLKGGLQPPTTIWVRFLLHLQGYNTRVRCRAYKKLYCQSIVVMFTYQVVLTTTLLEFTILIYWSFYLPSPTGRGVTLRQFLWIVGSHRTL